MERTIEQIDKFKKEHETELNHLMQQVKLAFNWSGSNTMFLAGELFKTPIRFIDPVKNPEELGITTAATDGKTIFVCPVFLKEKSLKQGIFLFAHELFHKLFGHCEPSRRVGTNPLLWNLAVDSVVNSSLQKSNIGEAIPGSILMEIYSEKVKLDFGNRGTLVIDKPYNKSAEEVYAEILDFFKDDLEKAEQMVAQMKQGGKSVGPIDKHDMGKPLSAEEKQDAEQSLRRIAIEGKLKGNAPGWLIKRIEEMFKPIVNWQNELRAFISPMIKTRQSYNKPHRNSHSLGVYLPHYKKEGVELTVAIDTSGSIGAREMNYFISEVESILKQFPAGSVNAHLLMHHVDVYCKRNSISSSELKDLQIETGGTSHVPVYEEARKLNTKLLVLLTDGYSDFPEIRPHGIQTIAVNTGCESSRKYYPAWIRRVIDVDPAEVRKNKR